MKDIRIKWIEVEDRVPANKKKHSIVFGIGINDSDYKACRTEVVIDDSGNTKRVTVAHIIELGLRC